jgi:hypothetical protein
VRRPGQLVGNLAPCESTFERPDIIARDSEHGAYLCKSRAQYTLVWEQGDNYETRHWSRRKVLSDADAIDRANKSLTKILQKQARPVDEVR